MTRCRPGWGRLLAELAGTGLLVAVVVGSGIAATRLTSDGALRLLVRALISELDA